MSDLMSGTEPFLAAHDVVPSRVRSPATLAVARRISETRDHSPLVAPAPAPSPLLSPVSTALHNRPTVPY